MAQPEAPVQPLPPWMATTWLQVGPSSSTFVTLQYPQTYSGPSLPGLTWPWVYQPTDALAGTAVSIIGGPAGLLTVGGSFATSGNPSPAAPPSTSSRPTVSAAQNSLDTSSSTPSPTGGSTNASSNLSVSASTNPTTLPSSNSPSPAFSTAQTNKPPTPSEDPLSAISLDPDLSTGAIIGLVLGVFILLILLLFLLLFCRRRKRARGRETSFTMLDPESQPVGVTLARNASGTQHPDRISQAPINPAAVRNTSPRRYMAERSSMRDLSARDAGEGNALMSYEDEEERLEDEEARIIGPSIMLQSPDSGASLRHCPSNNSLGTTTDNTESTRTRASLISQFPIHDRKPSDHSSRGGHEPGGAGGNAAGASGSRPAERKDGYHSGSGKSGSDSGMFSSPPPRPPSRTRTVPGQTPSTSIGLGRPPGSPAGPREPRLASLPERPTHSPYMSVPLHRNLSNRSSRSLMGAPVWLKGFTWLKPFFDSTTENPSGRMHEDAANVVDPEHGTARHSEDRLLPTSTPVMREVPQYRRVTTTAAVYDVQDLRDLAQRRPAGQSEDAEIFSNEEDSASDGEESSFLESSHVQSPPTSVPVEQDSSGRWSRATLGQPLQRISAISSLSLTDIPSLAGSMTSSARLQAKNRRSRSGSRSGSSHKSPQNSLSRATSRASMSSHNHSHSARSRSGSGSEGGQMGSKASSRRNNNSSSGSNASSGHGSHRSVKSGRTALGRVMEDGEAVPPLPPKPSAYA